MLKSNYAKLYNKDLVLIIRREGSDVKIFEARACYKHEWESVAIDNFLGMNFLENEMGRYLAV